MTAESIMVHSHCADPVGEEQVDPGINLRVADVEVGRDGRWSG